MTLTTYTVGVYRPGVSEAAAVTEPNGALHNKTLPGVILVHGHGGSATQFQPANVGPGLHTHQLAEAGYITIAPDAGGPSPWADDDEMTALTAAYNYLMNTMQVAGTKVYVVGWSMGGLASLNWIKRNPAKVAAAVIFSPATDITYFHGNATYGPEIDADYGGSANWQAGIVGHSPAGEPANYRGLPPIRIYHGDGDTTVPVSQTRTFVNAVNDPRLTLVVKPGADHVSIVNSITVAADILPFFRQFGVA